MIAHADCDCGKDILHPLLDFWQALVLEVIPITGLMFKVSHVFLIINISLIARLGSNGCDADSRVDEWTVLILLSKER